jgi:phenylacetate-CoA ligase
MINSIIKNIIYPLWDIKDNSIRLRELKSLEKSQWETSETLKQQQWKKTIAILQYAYENCKYYKNTLDEHGIKIKNINNYKDYLTIPVLSKKQIQENTPDLISATYKIDQLIAAKTGGSTGKALKIYFDEQCQQIRNAAAMRSDEWAGWSPGMKRAAIWGNPPLPDTWKKKIRMLLHDRFIFLDTMNLNPGSMDNFISQCEKHKSYIIFGHSHSIYIFAKYVLDGNIQNLRPRGIISTSMMLIPSERKVIEQAFGCKATDRYGCEEVGLIACECEEHKGMHLNIDHLFVEFIKEDGSPAGDGEEGVIVVTDLINNGMPLIRYKIEDVGIPTARECPCGRGLPLMEKVAGRVADFLVREDGSLVAGVSLVERTLTAIPGFEQMQIIQDEINSIKLNIVLNGNYKEKSKNMLIEELLTVFGKNVKIDISYVDNIPQERSGKYRFSICNVKNSSAN